MNDIQLEHISPTHSFGKQIQPECRLMCNPHMSQSAQAGAGAGNLKQVFKLLEMYVSHLD